MRIIYSYLNVLFLVLIILPVLFIHITANHDYFPFQLVNVFIAIWASLHLFPLAKKESCVNTNVMLYIFVYLFLVIAPAYQFSHQVLIWGGENIKDFDYFFTSLVIFIALLVYDLSYNFFYRKSALSIVGSCQKNIQINLRKKYVPLLVSVLSVIITLYSFREYPYLLFFREFNDGDKIVFNTFGSTLFNLIYIILIRPLPVIILTLYNLFYKKIDFYNVILLILVLFSNFPFSLPRFYVAAIYLPLLFSYYKRIMYNGLFFKIIIFIGVLYVFPFLNQSRTVTDINNIMFSFDLNYDMFLQGHFDTFQNFARVISHNTITYGKQILGVILFWVPRSMFVDKPIGSGGYIANLYNLDFDHISLNYWGEGWINFGFIGVILFSIILANINAKIDYKYWVRGNATLLFRAQYYVYLGLIFYILRGDLISCFAYTVGLLFVVFFCYKVFVL